MFSGSGTSYKAARSIGLLASSLTVTALPSDGAQIGGPSYWGNRPVVEPAYDAYPGKHQLNSEALMINGLSTPVELGKAIRDAGLWSGPRRALEQWQCSKRGRPACRWTRRPLVYVASYMDEPAWWDYRE